MLARAKWHAETSGIDDNPREKGSRLAESAMGSNLSGNPANHAGRLCENGDRFAALWQDMAAFVTEIKSHPFGSFGQLPKTCVSDAPSRSSLQP